MNKSFPKKEKLKRRQLIERLFEEGRAVKVFPIKAICLEELSLERNQAAFSVPKRNFKKAVERNHIKRLMREAYRLHKESFPLKNGKKIAVLFIYLGKEQPTYTGIEKAMWLALKKCALG